MLNYLSVPAPPVLSPPPPADRVFHALADPTRMAMVEHLSGGPASVSELARPLAISLPGVLQHLAVLEGDGLVRSEKVGRVRTCRIEPAALRAAGDWVAQRRAMWERSLDRLGDYLAEEARTEQDPTQPKETKR
jgi:DNA-binding transcriptional ArsR family regulator